MTSSDRGSASNVIGRYRLHGRIAAGGMAAVHFGRLLGPVGFSRIVAIKRLHSQFSMDPEFAAMFLDEARLAARIRHPNVVGTLDVVAVEDELFLVMEYVAGESLAKLVKEATKKGVRIPPAHAVGIMLGALHGLHAAHEAKNAAGEWLGIVHRDVSPHNVLVGEDGVARLIDFGVAKAIERVHSTRDGGLRGKVAYMAPEQLTQGRVDRRSDVYSASVVLWELVTGARYLENSNPAVAVRAALERDAEPPSRLVRGLPPGLDAVILQGLARAPEARFATALEMADALEKTLVPSSQRAIGQWVTELAGAALKQRAEILQHIETSDDPSEDFESQPSAQPQAPATSQALTTPGTSFREVQGEPSQPSSISVERTRADPGVRRSRSARRYAAGLGVVGASVVIVASFLFGRQSTLAPASGAAAAPNLSATASATPVALPVASPPASSVAPPTPPAATAAPRPPAPTNRGPGPHAAPHVASPHPSAPPLFSRD
jgi:serine/threonine-protein kinase